MTKSCVGGGGESCFDSTSGFMTGSRMKTRLGPRNRHFGGFGAGFGAGSGGGSGAEFGAGIAKGFEAVFGMILGGVVHATLLWGLGGEGGLWRGDIRFGWRNEGS
jgi:hypothetical protein